jgi:hypothetical protein
MTTTRYFRWDDAAAPTIEGVAGSFKAAMKAMLVGNGSGVAYGSGATEKLAAGWSVAFDSGDKVALRNSMAAGGTGCYLRIDDSNAQYASIQCYESMSDIDTGTGPAASAEFYVGKSGSASAGARAWVVCADERTVWGGNYLNSATPPTPSGAQVEAQWASAWGAGDYDPFLAGDPGCFVAGKTLSTISGLAKCEMFLLAEIIGTAVTVAGVSLSRNNSLSVGSTLVRIPCLATASSNAPIGGGGGATASFPLSGYAGHVGITCFISTQNSIRGRLRGLLYPPYYAVPAAGLGTEVSVPGRPSGSLLVTLAGNPTGTNAASAGARLFVETVLPWD